MSEPAAVAPKRKRSLSRRILFWSLIAAFLGLIAWELVEYRRAVLLGRQWHAQFRRSNQALAFEKLDTTSCPKPLVRERRGGGATVTYRFGGPFGKFFGTARITLTVMGRPYSEGAVTYMSGVGITFLGETDRPPKRTKKAGLGVSFRDFAKELEEYEIHFEMEKRDGDKTLYIEKSQRVRIETIGPAANLKKIIITPGPKTLEGRGAFPLTITATLNAMLPDDYYDKDPGGVADFVSVAPGKVALSGKTQSRTFGDVRMEYGARNGDFVVTFSVAD